MRFKNPDVAWILAASGLIGTAIWTVLLVLFFLANCLLGLELTGPLSLFFILYGIFSFFLYIEGVASGGVIFND